MKRVEVLPFSPSHTLSHTRTHTRTHLLCKVLLSVDDDVLRSALFRDFRFLFRRHCRDDVCSPDREREKERERERERGKQGRRNERERERKESLFIPLRAKLAQNLRVECKLIAS